MLYTYVQYVYVYTYYIRTYMTLYITCMDGVYVTLDAIFITKGKDVDNFTIIKFFSQFEQEGSYIM